MNRCFKINPVKPFIWVVFLLALPCLADNALVQISESGGLKAGYWGPSDYSLLPEMKAAGPNSLLVCDNSIVSLFNDNNIRAGYIGLIDLDTSPYPRPYKTDVISKMKMAGLTVAIAKPGWSFPQILRASDPANTIKQRYQVKAWIEHCKAANMPLIFCLNMWHSETLFDEKRKLRPYRLYVDRNGDDYAYANGVYRGVVTPVPCPNDPDYQTLTLNREKTLMNYVPDRPIGNTKPVSELIDGLIFDLELLGFTFGSKAVSKDKEGFDNRYPGPCYCSTCMNAYKAVTSALSGITGQDLRNKLQQTTPVDYADAYYEFQRNQFAVFGAKLRNLVPKSIIMGGLFLDTSVEYIARSPGVSNFAAYNGRKVPYYDGLAIGLGGNGKNPVFNFSEYTYTGKAWANDEYRNGEPTDKFIERSKKYFNVLKVDICTVPGIGTRYPKNAAEFRAWMSDYHQFWLHTIGAPTDGVEAKRYWDDIYALWK